MTTSISTESPLVTLSAAARQAVLAFMKAEGVDVAHGGLRIGVQPGGCSGFKYNLLVEDTSADDDIIVQDEGFRIFVDPFSASYMKGITIDYVTAFEGSGFTFKNPNATGGCGCGSSFSA